MQEKHYLANDTSYIISDRIAIPLLSFLLLFCFLYFMHTICIFRFHFSCELPSDHINQEFPQIMCGYSKLLKQSYPTRIIYCMHNGVVLVLITRPCCTISPVSNTPAFMRKMKTADMHIYVEQMTFENFST